MAKLTLSVDEEVVRGAKRYAAARGTSVSRLVERYLVQRVYGLGKTDLIQVFVQKDNAVKRIVVRKACPLNRHRLNRYVPVSRRGKVHFRERHARRFQRC